MSELLLRYGLSNLALSAALAGLAWGLTRRGQRPGVVHFLCLLVLLKLVTPPLLGLPLLPRAPGAPSAGQAAPPLELGPASASPLLEAGALRESALGAAPSGWAGPSATEAALAAWLLGSLVLLALGARRALRFDRLLRDSSRPAPAELDALASELAARLGLRRAPALWLTSARLSPLVWWLGGRPRVYLSVDLVERLSAEELRLTLAHELAHLRRRDHLVRWLEWLALLVAWWNPVTWWARRQLRASEELCCDALVLRALAAPPKRYASALLRVVELLSTPAPRRAPALACALHEGGSLEGRIRMIVSSPPAPLSRRLRLGAAVLAALLLPLGVSRAQEPDYEAVSERLLEAVREGELSPQQAKAMLGALAASRFQQRLDAERTHDEREEEAEREQLSERYERLGLSEEHLERISRSLIEAGLEEEQLRETLEVMAKLIRLLREGGGVLEPDTARAFKEHFRREVELKGEQQARVWGIAKKIAHHLAQRGHERKLVAAKKKLWALVEAGELSEADAKAKLEALAGALKRARDPKRELAAAKKKLWALVEAGELSEEDAERKWKATLEHFQRQQQEQRHGAQEEEQQQQQEGAGEEALSAWEHLQQGQRWLKLRPRADMTGAIDAFCEALRLDPKLADAYYWRGVAYYECRRFEDAYPDLHRALKLAPQGTGTFHASDPYYALGLCYVAREEWSEAVKVLERFLDSSPAGHRGRELALKLIAKAQGRLAR